MTDRQLTGDEPEEESIAEGSGDVIHISGNIVNSTIIVKSVVRDEQAVDLEKLPPEPGEPPYQGLQYFDEADANRFFGREQLTARVIGRLARTRFLAVIGASGSGKSSLVRAGVIPALKSGTRLADGSLPPAGSVHWSYRVFNPGGHPLDALAATLSRADALPSQINSLRDELAANPKSLILAAQSLMTQEEGPHLLLVVDQFEEIYTQVRSPEEREAFINVLISASSLEDSQPLSLLLCLRADFYAQVAQHHRLREMVSEHQEFIGAMNQAELVDAIVAPLLQGNWQIQEGLVKVILHDVGYEPGALPLLSHALLETWRRRRGRTLTLSGYVGSGGIDGAIRETADAVFNQRLTEEQKLIARIIFLRLAELNVDAQETRRRASFDELITRSTDEMTIQTVINILAEARLVTTSTTESGSTKVVEVAHESLIREWPTLQRWLHEDRQGLFLHRQLTEATKDWIENDRDTALLIRGKRLAQIREWTTRGNNADLISLTEQEFLNSSQAAGRRERLPILILGILTLILIGITLFIVGKWSYQQFRHYQAIQRSPVVTLQGGEIIFGRDDPEPFIGPPSLNPPLEEVSVDTFSMEITEVTNQRYRDCVDIGVCDPPSDRQFYDEPFFDQHPVVFVSAGQATTYCAWLGRRLPTIYEWELAARGHDGKPWPWYDSALPSDDVRNKLSPDHANLIVDHNHPPEGTEPVGSYPLGASREGIHDLVGNVWEWTIVPQSEQDNNSPSPTEMLSPGGFLLRGGSFDSELENITYIPIFPPGFPLPDANIGFRCVK